LRVLIKARSRHEWDIFVVDGHRAGEFLASVEGLCLDHAAFNVDEIVGSVSAVWGATLSETITNDLELLTGLGLGSKYGKWRDLTRPRRVFVGEVGFYDEESGRMIHTASRANLLNGEILYHH